MMIASGLRISRYDYKSMDTSKYTALGIPTLQHDTLCTLCIYTYIANCVTYIHIPLCIIYFDVNLTYIHASNKI